jgi:hypothetical protein
MWVLTRSGTKVDDPLGMIPYRRMNQLSICQFQYHGVLHILPVLLNVIIGNGISATPIAVIPGKTQTRLVQRLHNAMRHRQATVTQQ